MPDPAASDERASTGRAEDDGETATEEERRGRSEETSDARFEPAEGGETLDETFGQAAADEAGQDTEFQTRPVTEHDFAWRRDSDGDGISDSQERRLGLDPGSTDTDADGVSDSDELDRGSDPRVANTASWTPEDADEDGLSNAVEAELGSNPMSPTKFIDDDGNTLTTDEALTRIVEQRARGDEIAEIDLKGRLGLPTTPAENELLEKAARDRQERLNDAIEDAEARGKQLLENPDKGTVEDRLRVARNLELSGSGSEIGEALTGQVFGDGTGTGTGTGTGSGTGTGGTGTGTGGSGTGIDRDALGDLRAPGGSTEPLDSGSAGDGAGGYKLGEADDAAPTAPPLVQAGETGSGADLGEWKDFPEPTSSQGTGTTPGASDNRDKQQPPGTSGTGPSVPGTSGASGGQDSWGMEVNAGGKDSYRDIRPDGSVRVEHDDGSVDHYDPDGNLVYHKDGGSGDAWGQDPDATTSETGSDTNPASGTTDDDTDDTDDTDTDDDTDDTDDDTDDEDTATARPTEDGSESTAQDPFGIAGAGRLRMPGGAQPETDPSLDETSSGSPVFTGPRGGGVTDPPQDSGTGELTLTTAARLGNSPVVNPTDPAVADAYGTPTAPPDDPRGGGLFRAGDSMLAGDGGGTGGEQDPPGTGTASYAMTSDEGADAGASAAEGEGDAAEGEGDAAPVGSGGGTIYSTAGSGGAGSADEESWQTVTGSGGGGTTYAVRDDLVLDRSVREMDRSAAYATDDRAATLDHDSVVGGRLPGGDLGRPPDLPEHFDVATAAPDGTAIGRDPTGATGDAITGASSDLSADIAGRAGSLGGNALSGPRLDPLGLMDTEDAGPTTGSERPADERIIGDDTSLYAQDGANKVGGVVLKAFDDALPTGEKPTPTPRAEPKDEGSTWYKPWTWFNDDQKPEDIKPIDKPKPKPPEDNYYDNPEGDRDTTPTAKDLADAVEMAGSRGGTTQPTNNPNDTGTASGTPQSVMPRDDLVKMPAGEEDTDTTLTTAAKLGANPVVNPIDTALGDTPYTGGGTGFGGGPGGGDTTPTSVSGFGFDEGGPAGPPSGGSSSSVAGAPSSGAPASAPAGETTAPGGSPPVAEATAGEGSTATAAAAEPVPAEPPPPPPDDDITGATATTAELPRPPAEPAPARAVANLASATEPPPALEPAPAAPAPEPPPAPPEVPDAAAAPAALEPEPPPDDEPVPPAEEG